MPNIKNALGIDMAGLAQLIRSQGRGKDTVLAHITPREAALLKANGGSGTTNPVTGLPEFQEYYDFDVQDINAEQATMAQFPEYYPPSQGDFSGDYQYRFGTAPELTREQTVFSPGQPVRAEYVNPITEQRTSNFGEFGELEGRYGGRAPTPEEFGMALPSGLNQYELAAAGVPPTPSELAQSQAPSALERGIEAVKERLGKATLQDVLRVGGALGLGALGVSRSRQGQQQAANLQSQLQQMAQPYYQTGQEYIARGQQGNLLPVQQQQLEAMRAQAAQTRARAGVPATSTMGAQQEAAITRQADLFRQQLVDYGFKLVGVGDQITKGAVQAGYSASQDAQNAAARFYMAMGQMIPGSTVGTPTQPQPTRTA